MFVYGEVLDIDLQKRFYEYTCFFLVSKSIDCSLHVSIDYSNDVAHEACRNVRDLQFLSLNQLNTDQHDHGDQFDFCVFAMVHRLSKGAIVQTELCMYFYTKKYI